MIDGPGANLVSWWRSDESITRAFRIEPGEMTDLKSRLFAWFFGYVYAGRAVDRPL